MPNFAKRFDLPVVKLRHADIVQLGRMLCEGIELKPDTNKFSVFREDEGYDASSIEGLMSQDLPETVDALSFRVVGWRDKQIVQEVNVDLHRTWSSCQINSSGDEIWFSGKRQQIINFFMKHRPWYGRIKQSVFLLTSYMTINICYIIMFGSIGASLWQIVYRDDVHLGLFILIVIAMTLIVINSLALRLYWKGRFFPTTDIQLREQPRRLSHEVLMVVFAGVMALAAVATAIIQVIQVARP